MALDSRLIDFWKKPTEEESFIEISPSGKFYVYDPFFSYEITNEGTKLVIHYPKETAVFTRVGEPSESLVGEWSRIVAKEGREKEEKETWIYLSDGTYIGHWDEIEWFNGFYLDIDNTVRTAEFRGTISTENFMWLQEYDGDAFEYWYELLDNENKLILHNVVTDVVVVTYVRKVE